MSADSNAKVEEEDERKAARKIGDEAAGNAKAVLDWLRPSSARTDRLVFVLRNAANVAKTATLTRVESRRVLDATRGEAARSLNAACTPCWTGDGSRKKQSMKRAARFYRG